MLRRRGTAALAAALVAASALALSGCSAPGSAVVDGSSIAVGLDVPYTGVGPASPDATAADVAVAAATLSGFSYLDETGASVPDAGFGTITVLDEAPLTVGYTVADGLEWSDGVGIDGVDLLLDWAARAHPYAGAPFGSEPDLSLSGARDVRLSEDRKSLTIEFGETHGDFSAAFRAPLPAHVVAERAFGSASAEHAKDDVIAAIEAAGEGEVEALAELGAAWGSVFDPTRPLPPASGPYRLDDVAGDLVTLVVNDAYRGPRTPTYEELSLRTLADGAAAVQALSIGELDLVQLRWDEGLRNALARIGADRRELPDPAAPTTLVGWFHRGLGNVAAGATVGALWNPWQWAPYVLAED
ncbi:MAG: hypothetical protein J7480_04605 [Microbacteriaceae bacterium]|nr:hypothetical protein [Microbacteriaceae bacterium]